MGGFIPRLVFLEEEGHIRKEMEQASVQYSSVACTSSPRSGTVIRTKRGKIKPLLHKLLFGHGI